MKRLLITGANGFLGHHCLPRLMSFADEVHAITSRPVATKEACDLAKVRWHQADLRDSQESMHIVRDIRPTHLLHLAWITTPGEFWNSAENERWLQASKRLLSTFATVGGRRVVVAGSCAEYDWNVGVCSEHDTPLRPSTPYGQAKHALQEFLASLSQNAHLSTAWGRLFFLFGPGMSEQKFPAAVIAPIVDGRPALCTHGRQRRDFLHIADAADALVTLLKSPLTGPVNIASGQAVELADIAKRIASYLGRDDLLRLGAKPANPNEPPLLVADVQRLHCELGWTQTNELDIGLKATIEWWKDNSQHHRSACA